MNKKEIRLKLTEYDNGGNAYLLLEYLLDFNKKEIKISQVLLAKQIKKTRPTINKSLALLKKIKVLDYSYGKIYIKGELYEG